MRRSLRKRLQWHNGTPEDGCFGPKHIVLRVKANVNEEINSCIIDRKLYVNKVEYRMQLKYKTGS
jgi:hypothetical protein